MQNRKSHRTGSTTVELVAVVSMIVLMIVLLIPVVQCRDDDTVSPRVAQDINRLELPSYPSSDSSGSVEL